MTTTTTDTARYVYVDDAFDYGWRLGWNCHMMPEDVREPASIALLHEEAARIGMKRAWFQQERADRPHYDLTIPRRDAALKSPRVIAIDLRGWLRMQRYLAQGWFIELGSGARMELGRWYTIADSGSIYSGCDGATPEEALAKLRAGEYAKECGWSEDDVAVHLDAHPEDPLGDSPGAANVVSARAMLRFWCLTDSLGLAMLQTRGGRP